MSDLVNLRLVRKRRAREAADRLAAEQRARFGRSKAETQAEAERRALAARVLDGHRRDRPDEP
jgi:hypothetical protein